jgi:hypothetical protein
MADHEHKLEVMLNVLKVLGIHKQVVTLTCDYPIK